MRIPDPIANTTTEAYLAYKAGVLSEGDLKPKLYDPYIHLDAWLAYWAGLTKSYPVKNVGKNLFNMGTSLSDWFQTFHDGVDINSYTITRTTATIENNKLVIDSYDNTGYTWISRWVSLEKNTGYVISGKNTQAIRIVGFNSKELFSEGTLIKVKAKAPDGGTTTFNTGDYNYYAISFYPSGADDYFENIQIEKGSTATAYEPYTGEPEMLTDEEAYIAYLSGVTNTYPEEFRDPADVRVAAYLKYLVSARWGRPEYPVTNEELYLSMMDAPYIPAGEPSSDIEIDDTAEAPFKDVKMYGDTSQTTYTGKNLWPINSSIPTYNCTITPGDNSLTIVATGVNSNIYPHFYLEADTQYTFSGEFKITNYVGASSIGVIIQGYDGNAWVVIKDERSEVSDTNTHTFSVSFNSASYSMVRVGFGTNVWNTSVANTVVLSNPQLEKGSTATSYEPYVGGVPAPNPDYPQAVNTVTGRQVVKVTGEGGESGEYEINLGKNLCDLNATFPLNINGVTVTKEADGSVTLNGTLTSSTNITFSQNNIGDLKYLQGQMVTLSFSTSGTGRIINIGLKQDGNPVFEAATSPKTVTVDFGTKTYTVWQAWCISGTVYNNFNLKVQLELGSEATSYAPYFTPIELCKIGDYQDYIWNDNGTWYVHKAIDKIILDGNTEGWTSWPYPTLDRYYTSALSGKIAGLPQTTVALLSHFKFFGVGSGVDSINKCLFNMSSGTVVANGNITLTFKKDSMPTVASVSTWLSDNPVSLYCSLTTATNTEITNTALIDQLNALKNGGSYTGTTYIKVSATDPNLPGLLKVEAYKYD